MNKENPKVSVIIPVYNGEKMLSACLDSLVALDFSKDAMEIIVVDNNSTDRTKEIINRYPVKYVFELKRGRGSARNSGIRASSGEFIAFTDSDCVVDKNWLKELIKGFDSEDIVACGGKISAFKTDNWLEKYAESRALLGQEEAINCDLISDLPRVVTANAIFRRDMLEKLENFDENLITSEDTDIGWRITFSGLRMKYAPDAVIYHQHINNLWRYCLHQVDFGIANYLLMKKYGFLSDKLFSKLLKPFLLIQRVVFKIFIFTAMFFNPKEENKNFLILDIFTAVFTIWGKLKMAVKDIFIPQSASLHRQTTLNNSSNNFQIKDTSCYWALAKYAVWFANDGMVKFKNFKNSSYYGLNSTATKIWHMLSDKGDVFIASDLLSEQFGISKDSALNDVKDLIKQLKKESLLVKIN